MTQRQGQKVCSRHGLLGCAECEYVHDQPCSNCRGLGSVPHGPDDSEPCDVRGCEAGARVRRVRGWGS